MNSKDFEVTQKWQKQMCFFDHLLSNFDYLIIFLNEIV